MQSALACLGIKEPLMLSFDVIEFPKQQLKQSLRILAPLILVEDMQPAKIRMVLQPACVCLVTLALLQIAVRSAPSMQIVPML
jgi:hypothetical protein